MNASLRRIAGTKAPGNLRSLYWSARGAVPGRRGNAFVIGHTYDSKPSGKGVLDKLKRLSRGKLIKVIKGSKTIQFKVGRTEILPLHPSEEKMADLLSHLGPSRMTVITCLWNKKLGKYTKLLVKHAKLVRTKKNR